MRDNIPMNLRLHITLLQFHLIPTSTRVTAFDDWNVDQGVCLLSLCAYKRTAKNIALHVDLECGGLARFRL